MNAEESTSNAETSEIKNVDSRVSGSALNLNTLNKGTENMIDESAQPLLFFNYHEYSIRNYQKIGSNVVDIYSQTLSATHFPNSYVPPSSPEYSNTRIVRIPRVFTGQGATYPQFSTVLPGFEDAAIVYEGDGSSFIPRGKYEGQIYGYSSNSPLNNYITPEEFEEIMNKINAKMIRSYTPFVLWNVLEFIIDLLTFWLFSGLIKFSSKRRLEELEEYVEKVNRDLEPKNIRVISPRRSGYLSIDYVIPRPEAPCETTL